MTIPSSQRHTKIKVATAKEPAVKRLTTSPVNLHWCCFKHLLKCVARVLTLKKIKHINIYIHTYSLIGAAYPKVQQVHVGAVPVKWVKHRSEERSCSLCRDVCLCGAAKYKNVLNAIMEDGEAKVLGLRRSKPLFFFFFGWEGAFLIQNSSTKDFQ